MKILGISCFYHESAACLLSDGTIVAASAEERFTRLKHDSSFPTNAIQFCLKQGNLQAYKLDYVVFYEKPFRKFERNLTISLQHFPSSYSFFVDSMKNFLTEKLWIKSIIASKLNIAPEKILFIPHHLSHAAASFYSSPFANAAFLTLDGVGEWTTGSWGFAKNNKLYPKCEMRFPHSVGLLYATFTAFLGFEVNDGEYKVMGMAGYGKPYHVNKVKKLYQQHQDGSLTLNLEYFTFHRSSKQMYSRKFEQLFYGLNRFDIAASLQACTEDIVFAMLNHVHRQTREENLVYGGGVALNSLLNGKITRLTPFEKIFIFPAAGDDGGAVGAALYVHHHVLGNEKRNRLKHIFLGVNYSNNEIMDVIARPRSGEAISRLPRSLSVARNDKPVYSQMSKQRLIAYVAGKLSDGKVVGWFEGRAEFGPRALGHRSILADPRNPKIKNIVNKKIKFREEFRPFAPTVLTEYTKEYFDEVDNSLAPFMLGAFRAKAITMRVAPAVVHIDGTSRIQTVDKNYTGTLRQLIEAFYKKTGVPMILNTSFNLQGEPIVNSPKDALDTFLGSGLDILVLENYVVEKV